MPSAHVQTLLIESMESKLKIWAMRGTRADKEGVYWFSLPHRSCPSLLNDVLFGLLSLTWQFLSFLCSGFRELIVCDIFPSFDSLFSGSDSRTDLNRLKLIFYFSDEFQSQSLLFSCGANRFFICKLQSWKVPSSIHPSIYPLVENRK